MSLGSVSDDNAQVGDGSTLTSDGASPGDGNGETQEIMAQAFAKKHLRWNFISLMTDYGLYGLGMTFASVSTILPAFAERLGASNLMIGMIPAAMTLGFTLRRSLPPILPKGSSASFRSS